MHRRKNLMKHVEEWRALASDEDAVYDNGINY